MQMFTQLFGIIRELSLTSTASNNKSKSKQSKGVGLDAEVANSFIHLIRLNLDNERIDLSNERELNNAIKMVFQRLDLDGDGSLSWWEWKELLNSSLNTNKQLKCTGDENTMSSLILPSDPLVMGLEAAHQALASLKSSERESRKQYAIKDAKITESDIRPYISAGSPVLEPHGDGTETWNDADDVSVCNSVDIKSAMSMPPPKAVLKLHDMVLSLRSSRARLVQKLEKAIEAANGGTLMGSPDTMNNTASNPKFSDIGGSVDEREDRSNPVVMRRRIKEMEIEVQKLRELFELERQRATQLETEVDVLKGSSALQEKHRNERILSVQETQMALQAEIDKHMQELGATKQLFKKQRRSMSVLKKFFRTYVTNYRIRKRREGEWTLTHFLTGAVTRKKYLSIQKERNNAVTKIQSRYRGMQGRQRVQRLRMCALHLQRIVRGWRDRKVVSDLRDQKLRQLHQQRVCRSAVVIQSLWRKHTAMENTKKLRIINQHILSHCSSAQVTVQAGIQGKHSRLMAEIERERLKRELAAYKLQNVYRKLQNQLEQERLARRIQASITIQCAIRCFNAKKRFSFRKLAHRKLSETEMIQQNAAVIIQREARALLGRKKVSNMRQDNAEEMIRVVEADWVSRLKRYRLQMREKAEMELAQKMMAAKIELELKNSAAIKIQSIQRGRQSRKFAEELMLKNKDMLMTTSREHAAIKIQSVARLR